MGQVTLVTVFKYNSAADSWTRLGPDGAISGSRALALSLAVSADGVPFLATADPTAGERASVFRFDGSAWAAVGPLGFSSSPADWCYLAVDRLGSPWLAWQSGWPSGAVNVDHFDAGSGAWLRGGGEPVAPTSGIAPRLAFDPAAPYLPVVAYATASDGIAIRRWPGPPRPPMPPLPPRCGVRCSGHVAVHHNIE